MIKNLIILFLICIIGVLLFASSSNVDLLKQKAVEVKEFIWKGTTWFKTQAEESYPKEKNKVAPWDAPTSITVTAVFPPTRGDTGRTLE